MTDKPMPPIRRIPEAPRKPIATLDYLGMPFEEEGEPVDWLDDDERDPDPIGPDPHTDNVGDEGE
jgi:hypothetical protein